MTDPILFILAAAALLAAPGPTNTLLAIAGVRGASVRSLALVGAVLVAYMLAIAAYRLALAPLLQAYPPLAVGLKVAAACYAAWLAIRLWVSSTQMDTRAVGARELFLATLFNPKALIAAITLIPQTGPLVMFAALFTVVACISSLGWLLLGSVAAASAGRHAHAIPRLGSVALLGFAGLIAASALG